MKSSIISIYEKTIIDLRQFYSLGVKFNIRLPFYQSEEIDSQISLVVNRRRLLNRSPSHGSAFDRTGIGSGMATGYGAGIGRGHLGAGRHRRRHHRARRGGFSLLRLRRFGDHCGLRGALVDAVGEALHRVGILGAFLNKKFDVLPS